MNDFDVCPTGSRRVLDENTVLLERLRAALQEQRREIERLEAELKKANARERDAFMAGFEMDSDCRMGEPHTKPNPEQKWMEYRCQDDTDWRATDE